MKLVRTFFLGGGEGGGVINGSESQDYFVRAGPFTFKIDATCLSYICVYSAHCLIIIIPLALEGP